MCGLLDTADGKSMLQQMRCVPEEQIARHNGGTRKVADHEMKIPTYRHGSVLAIAILLEGEALPAGRIGDRLALRVLKFAIVAVAALAVVAVRAADLDRLDVHSRGRH